MIRAYTATNSLIRPVHAPFIQTFLNSRYIVEKEVNPQRIRKRVDGDIFESGKKKLRIQKHPDTCGRDLNVRVNKHAAVCGEIQPASCMQWVTYSTAWQRYSFNSYSAGGTLVSFCLPAMKHTSSPRGLNGHGKSLFFLTTILVRQSNERSALSEFTIPFNSTWPSHCIITVVFLLTFHSLTDSAFQRQLPQTYQVRRMIPTNGIPAIRGQLNIYLTELAAMTLRWVERARGFVVSVVAKLHNESSLRPNISFL